MAVTVLAAATQPPSYPSSDSPRALEHFAGPGSSEQHVHRSNIIALNLFGLSPWMSFPSLPDPDSDHLTAWDSDDLDRDTDMESEEDWPAELATRNLFMID
jgi:hypothetical protein